MLEEIERRSENCITRTGSGMTVSVQDVDGKHCSGNGTGRITIYWFLAKH